ncbi:MAG: hypothetical protein IIY54_00105 [Ruminococcus sp.]|nr:hypothetical protein [Ruminococcus sp.]
MSDKERQGEPIKWQIAKGPFFPDDIPLKTLERIKAITSDPQKMELLNAFFALPQSRIDLFGVIVAGYEAEKNNPPIKGHSLEEIIRAGFYDNGDISNSPYRAFFINADRLYKDQKKLKVYQPVDALTSAIFRVPPQKEDDGKVLQVYMGKNGSDKVKALVYNAGDDGRYSIGFLGGLVLKYFVSICMTGKSEISDREVAQLMTGKRNPSPRTVSEVRDQINKLNSKVKLIIEGEKIVTSEFAIPGKRKVRKSDGRTSTEIYKNCWLIDLYNAYGRFTTGTPEKAAFPLSLTEENARLFDFWERRLNRIKRRQVRTTVKTSSIYTAMNAVTKNEKQNARGQTVKILNDYLNRGRIIKYEEIKDEKTGERAYKITYPTTKKWQGTKLRKI